MCARGRDDVVDRVSSIQRDVVGIFSRKLVLCTLVLTRGNARCITTASPLLGSVLAQTRACLHVCVCDCSWKSHAWKSPVFKGPSLPSSLECTFARGESWKCDPGGSRCGTKFAKIFLFMKKIEDHLALDRTGGLHTCSPGRLSALRSLRSRAKRCPLPPCAPGVTARCGLAALEAAPAFQLECRRSCRLAVFF